MTTEEAISQLAGLTNTKTAFVGLGNRDRGDDAVGLRFAEDLKRLNPNQFYSEEQGLEGVVLDLMKKAEFDTVIFVDACECGGKPGDVTMNRLDTIAETVSTHKIPLSMLMGLIQNTGKRTFMLGIQPESMDFQQELSGTVRSALDSIEKTVRDRLEA